MALTFVFQIHNINTKGFVVLDKVCSYASDPHVFVSAVMSRILQNARKYSGTFLVVQDYDYRLFRIPLVCITKSHDLMFVGNILITLYNKVNYQTHTHTWFTGEIAIYTGEVMKRYDISWKTQIGYSCPRWLHDGKQKCDICNSVFRYVDRGITALEQSTQNPLIYNTQLSVDDFLKYRRYKLQ